MPKQPEYQVVKYKSDKKTFELLVKPGTVSKFREGKLGIDNVYYTDEIFMNFQKGEKARDSDLENAFKTKDKMKIIETILKHGESQLSTEERRERIVQKTNEIVNFIHKYYVEPKTRSPIPVTRINAALETVKFHATLEDSVERQVAVLMPRLCGVLTCVKVVMEGTLTVPAQAVAKCAGILKKYAQIQSQQFRGASCVMRISVIPGDFDALLCELSNATDGAADFAADVATTQSQQQTTAEKTKPQRGGKGKRGGKK